MNLASKRGYLNQNIARTRVGARDILLIYQAAILLPSVI